MAIVMLVASEEAGEPSIGPVVADRLASLGVTRLALLRDGRTNGIVLEGWAFDPAHGSEAAGVLFTGGTTNVRTFREIEIVGLPAARQRNSRTRSEV